MPKTLRHIVAVLLLPCLLAEPGITSAFSSSPRVQDTPFRLHPFFNQQAIPARLRHFFRQRKLDVQQGAAAQMKAEALIRETLRTTPFKEVRHPDGEVLGAQSRVLMAEAADFVLKITRTRRETKKILRRWQSTERFESWVQAIHSGKRRGERIVAERLAGSRGIYPEQVLKKVRFLETTEHGIRAKHARRARVQRKGPEVLWQAIQRLYQAGDTEGVKSLLEEVLETTKEELWSYGVFDRASGIVENWAVEWDSDGKPNVGLFDFGELVDRIELIGDPSAKTYRLSSTFWEKDWAIYQTSHVHSILSLTNLETADWFFRRVTEEFTVEHLRHYWNQKSHPLLHPKENQAALVLWLKETLPQMVHELEKGSLPSDAVRQSWLRPLQAEAPELTRLWEAWFQGLKRRASPIEDPMDILSDRIRADLGLICHIDFSINPENGSVTEVEGFLGETVPERRRAFRHKPTGGRIAVEIVRPLWQSSSFSTDAAAFSKHLWMLESEAGTPKRERKIVSEELQHVADRYQTIEVHDRVLSALGGSVADSDALYGVYRETAAWLARLSDPELSSDDILAELNDAALFYETVGSQMTASELERVLSAYLLARMVNELGATGGNVKRWAVLMDRQIFGPEHRMWFEVMEEILGDDAGVGQGRVMPAFFALGLSSFWMNHPVVAAVLSVLPLIAWYGQGSFTAGFRKLSRMENSGRRITAYRVLLAQAA